MADAAEKERQEEVERAAASLRAASVGGFAPLLRMLIKKHKAKFPDDFDEKILNGPDKDGNTSLYHAAFVGHVEVTEVLLGQPGIDPNKKNSKEVTPLRAGLGNDNPEAAELLLEHEDADGKLEVDGSKACHQNWNPLCHASANGYIHVVNLLLRRANITGPPDAAAAAGSELDLQDGDGNTALFLACSGGHVRVVKSLLKAGAGINVMSKGNLSPLYGAASAGHARVVEILLSHSEKPNHALRSDEGDNALDAAVKGGHNAVAELLMEL
ncbi:putative ankyrin repeat domain-containing protein [Cladorrhinum samala]|uniref:Ankyrin repeat domain-containing protein n=1 Tax=Cladorrhinum samala TaxID=585594 RepID=A0AAV9HKZ4_9PEZI|nr:putative ankyrin repeat domain-containing protein [Cladorrhinum samala]